MVFFHPFLGLFVGRSNDESVFVDPFAEQLLVGLSDDEVVFVGGEFHLFCVCPLVEGPSEGLSVVRVEEHQHFRQISVAVKDVLRRVLCNIQNPIERLKGNVRNV